MKKTKRKGFTLIELLVSISILGIITVMAIPSISQLTDNSRTQRYEKYGQTLIEAAKLYTTSYSMDMFDETDNCFDIPLDELEKKHLAKDIEYKDISCADYDNKRTFVRVKRTNDEYEYQISLYCVDDKDNPQYTNYISNSEAICKGGNDPKEVSGTWVPDTTIVGAGPYIYAEKEGSDTYIKVKDDDGLASNIQIKYAWSSKSDGTDVTDSSLKILNFSNAASVKEIKQKVTKEGSKTYIVVKNTDQTKDINFNIRNQKDVFGPF